MIVKLFQPRFCDAVRTGAKLTTIRPMPKETAFWRKSQWPKVGDKISLRAWTGKPYRSKQDVLRESVIVEVAKIDISRAHLHEIKFNDHVLTFTELDTLALADGFEPYVEEGIRMYGAASSLFAWFEETHGLPFTGLYIRWT